MLNAVSEIKQLNLENTEIKDKKENRKKNNYCSRGKCKTTKECVQEIR